MQMATHSLIAADLISEQLVVGHDLFRSQKGNRVSYPQHHADEVVDIVIIVQAAQALQRSDLKMVSTVLFKITTHTHTHKHIHTVGESGSGVMSACSVGNPSGWPKWKRRKIGYE